MVDDILLFVSFVEADFNNLGKCENWSAVIYKI